ncbi:dihydrolipoyl dehydrogenase [Mycoplasma phocoenae]|uniref:Dihydrolipoyl dehydrogenase n=1 Tax=Mycoplasma phocoenae TaxID=754517 RepID=A0A858U957_9MOLU|nr:dihydrolipoyl dehydrogenase [Mycoplasma phocoenae]QJG67238.1 dihydrolipoyl dehydrogenase [Mycoplasma phocoenae]
MSKYTGNIDAEYDLIVIGAGPGGYLAAEEGAKHGLKTLIVEKCYWGGVCLNVGCIPTKALLHATEEFHKAKTGELSKLGFTFDADSVQLDWNALQAQKAKTVTKLTGGVKMLMKGNKVEIIEDTAEFLDNNVLKAGDKVVKGKYMIYAMGSHSRRLNLPGFEQAYMDKKVVTSTGLINIESQPSSLTIIGGGVIGVEFGQVFATAGTKVTILQNLDRVLANLDKDVTDEVQKHLKKKGVEIIFNTTIKSYEDDHVVYEKDGEEFKIKSDIVLSSIGRIPNTGFLSKTDVKIGQRGEIVIDEKCKTNVENVYAIGDITGQNMLAHVAYKHAAIAVYDILNREGKCNTEIKYNPLTVAGCIYTDPEIASIGLTENAAKAQEKEYIATKWSFAYVGKAIAAHRDYGFCKLVVDKNNGKILGAQIIGANATDMITEIALAMDNDLNVFDLANSIHPHPTFNEIVWEAARQAVHKLEK